MATRPSEELAVIGTVDPDANATGNFDSDWANTEYWHQVFAVVKSGILASSGTLDASLRQATSSTGASAKAITGASITQLTTGDNDKQAIIELVCDALDVENGFSFVSLRMTHTTAGGDADGTLFGYGPRFGPASANDLASVDEIVTV